MLPMRNAPHQIVSSQRRPGGVGRRLRGLVDFDSALCILMSVAILLVIVGCSQGEPTNAVAAVPSESSAAPPRPASASAFNSPTPAASPERAGRNERPSERDLAVPGDHSAPREPERGVLELRVLTSPEKRPWLEEVLLGFAGPAATTTDGRLITVRTIAMDDEDSLGRVVSGALQVHLVSPSMRLTLDRANADSTELLGRPIFGAPRSLLRSPIVIAMWKPMAEALGWGERSVGWRDLVEIARHPQGWAHVGRASWGPLQFAYPHPRATSTGLATVSSQTAAFGPVVGSERWTSPSDEALAALRDLQRAVAHYGDAPSAVVRRLQVGGIDHLAAAVAFEHVVIDANRQRRGEWRLPLVAIYPSDGTIVCDHPIAMVDAQWNTPAHRAAAEHLVDYLLSFAAQQAALNRGFRPVRSDLPLDSALVPEFGVDCGEPRHELPMPALESVDDLLRIWSSIRRPVDLVVVLDGSAGLGAERFGLVREALIERVDRLADDDRIALLVFSTHLHWVFELAPAGASRKAFGAALDTIEQSGGAALHDAIEEATERLVRTRRPDSLAAILILTDSDDRGSRISARELLSRLRPDAARSGIRFFTVNFGGEADAVLLRAIAETGHGRYVETTSNGMRRALARVFNWF